MDVQFSKIINDLRRWNLSDIEIAEEVSKISKVPVTRQLIYNYRTGVRKYPANFHVGVALLQLHKKIKQREEMR